MNRERAFSRETQPDDPAGKSGARGATPATALSREAGSEGSDVDSVVSAFLRELDSVSSGNEATIASEDESANEPARADSPDGNVHLSPALRLAPLADDLEAKPLCSDVDAELSRTLHELESRVKSNVIPMNPREGAKHPALSLPAVDFKPSVPPPPPPISEELHETPEPVKQQPPHPSVADPAPSAAADLDDPRAPLSTMPESHSVRARVALIFAVVILVAILAAALYYLLRPEDQPVSQASVPEYQAPAGTSAENEGAKQKAAPSTVEQSRANTAAPLAAAPPAARQVRTAAKTQAGPKAAPPPRVGSERAQPAGSTVPDSSQAIKVGLRNPPVQPGAGRSDPPAVSVAAAPPVVPPQPSGQTAAKQAEAPQATAAGAQVTPVQTASIKTNPDNPPVEPPRTPSSPPPPAGTAAPASQPATGTKDAAPTAKAEPSPLATPAQPILRVAPDYPMLAARMRTEGSVSVRVEVNDQGNVARATAISGPPVLRPAAEDALKKWKFKPATLRGVNIKTELIIVVEFKR